MSDTTEAVAAPPTSSKAPLVAILISVVNLAVSGFVATKVVHAAKAESHDAQHVKPVAPPVNHPTVLFDPFVVNLNEPGSNRYLKASFEVELENDRAVEELNLRKRVVRDEVLRYLSSLQVANTQGEAGKSHIGEEVIARISKVIGTGKARHVYFADFVVQ